MPTVIIEHTVLDPSWPEALAAAGLGPGARTFRDGDAAVTVFDAVSVDEARDRLRSSGLVGLVEGGIIGTPTIKIVEPVAIARIEAGAVHVQRLWPKGRR